MGIARQRGDFDENKILEALKNAGADIENKEINFLSEAPEYVDTSRSGAIILEVGIYE